ncbi:amino acid permease [Streptomyces galilaeus]|uniref:amino acid permease n=1 Tax=Streptomyces galilaeus TaxID=33899 RepID=UPI001E4A8BA6|nr:amino acid permease [Streptomyces galilaeus]
MDGPRSALEAGTVDHLVTRTTYSPRPRRRNAISWVVPSDQLSLTAGVMQAFDAFFAYFGIGWLTPIAAVALVSASLGGMLTWLAGPSKGLLLISRQEGYLPPYLQKLNGRGVQQNILVTQGIVTSVIALMYALIPNVSSVYWIFSVITTQVYLIMYLLMFAAAVRLRKTQPDHPRGYRSPALTLVCAVGFAASAAALVIGFIPSSQFGGGSVWAYVGFIAAGLLLLGFVIPWLFLHCRKPSWRSPETAESTTGEVS